MPVVSARPNEYLLVGRRGTLENRGSAVRAVLMPGTIYVLVPSTKQEATFEFTQETKDAIPLRFKGIIIDRITDAIAAARLFDFSDGSGIDEITTLLTHVCLGELRHAVSHMTMSQCIEERKTTLSAVADAALQSTVHPTDAAKDWGLTVEVAQLAQVFIVDQALRQQLEAEIRNEIRLKADQSNLRTAGETRLAEMVSAGRLGEQQLASDRESLRREEELELARLERTRRKQAEDLATQRHTIELEQERIRAQAAADEDRLNTEAPIRLLKTAREREILTEELELRRLQDETEQLDVERRMRLPRAQQELRLRMLPVEQMPAIVESASKVLQGTTLSLYGESSQVLGQLAPFFEIVARSLRAATADVTDVGSNGRGSAA